MYNVLKQSPVFLQQHTQCVLHAVQSAKKRFREGRFWLRFVLCWCIFWARVAKHIVFFKKHNGADDGRNKMQKIYVWGPEWKRRTNNRSQQSLKQESAVKKGERRLNSETRQTINRNDTKCHVDFITEQTNTSFTASSLAPSYSMLLLSRLQLPPTQITRGWMPWSLCPCWRRWKGVKGKKYEVQIKFKLLRCLNDLIKNRK